MTNNKLPDSGERSIFETGAVRDAMQGKGCPSLLPIDALESCLKAVRRRSREVWT
jgi:hypothetical protein